MMHKHRVHCLGPVESAQRLAEKLTGSTGCLCTGFYVEGRPDYLFLNDSIHESGAGEYGVIKRTKDGFMQVESITFSWATTSEALDYVEQALRGEFDSQGWLLCDLTVPGKKIVERCLGLQDLGAHESWNGGNESNPHVASIMLAPEMFSPIAAFALLESGCIECWNIRGETVIGIEPTDDHPECVKWIVEWYGNKGVRRLAYRGTAGARNVHQMTQRVE